MSRGPALFRAARALHPLQDDQPASLAAT